jgi:hypothetical protein
MEIRLKSQCTLKEKVNTFIVYGFKHSEKRAQKKETEYLF